MLLEAEIRLHHPRRSAGISQRPELPDGPALLEACARKRGFLVSGGETDLERMSRVLLDEFQAGSLGRITLEEPEC